MGQNAQQQGMGGGGPFGSGASGGGTQVGMPGMMPSQGGPPQGGMGGNPYAAQQQQYMQYLSQALPNIQNGINAGTIQPGQQLQNFQGPQAFGLPGGGFGGMMPGGSMGGGSGMPSSGGMK